LHLIKTFRDIELLKENCEQRNLMVDINQLSSDYQRWQQEKKEYRRLRDLHHVQEKLREQKHRTNDLKVTDIQQTDTNKTKKQVKSDNTTTVTKADK
jgi:succinate dehydrogenase/fumarate reductase flavoprotein subunit